MLAGLVIYILLGTPFIFLSVLFIFATTLHVFSNDEKKTIQMLLSSLPYTRREIVSSRYLSLFVYTLLTLLVVLIGNYIVNNHFPSWKEIMFVIGIVMLIFSFIFPFTYKYKSNYLLFATIGIFILYMFVVNTLIPNLNDQIGSITAKILAFSDTKIMIGAIIILSLLYLISWLISIRVYEKKVF